MGQRGREMEVKIKGERERNPVGNSCSICRERSVGYQLTDRRGTAVPRCTTKILLHLSVLAPARVLCAGNTLAPVTADDVRGT